MGNAVIVVVYHTIDSFVPCQSMFTVYWCSAVCYYSIQEIFMLHHSRINYKLFKGNLCTYSVSWEESILINLRYVHYSRI
jgi:hypothetical protein